MIVITPPDMNDSFSRLVLENKEYLLRFTYDSTGDYWTFGIYRSENDPIVTSIKIVPCFPLNHFFKHTDMPQGIFAVITKQETVGRNAFTNGDAKFVFIPYSELTDEAKQYEIPEEMSAVLTQD